MEEMKKEKQRLTRSTQDKVIAGVCGGLAEYFKIDSTIIRIVFLILMFPSGMAALAYLIMWLVVPTDTSTTSKPTDTINENAKELEAEVEALADKLESQLSGNGGPDTGRDTNWLGIGLIGVGVWFLMQNFGFGRFFDIDRLWPVAIIAVGIYFMMDRQR